ncbi:MAG: YopX family protein [Candidatus Thorarchaeota archaeon]
MSNDEQRELKFRAKLIERHQGITTDGWYYFDMDDLFHDWELKHLIDKEWLRLDTLCQWTGEMDTNEVDIYEKDIWSDGRTNHRFVIKDLEQFYWAKFDDQMHLNFESGYVIGNTIDNPELLGDING